MRSLLIVLVVLVSACTGATSPTVPDRPATTTGATAATTTTDAPVSTQTAPAEAGTVEVSIPATGLELAGTLHLPAGDRPAPGVVLVHGSGPQSRDSTLPGQLNMAFGFEIAVFAELADALQEAGIAVLVYDKRSCGTFNGCADNDYELPADDITVDTFMDDARAALVFLRNRPEIDPDRVSVIGHSQGAQFVIPILESDPDLYGGAMLAGPYRPIDEITAAQLDFTIELLADLGMGEEEARAVPGVAMLVDLVDGLEAIREGGEEPAGGVSAAFWRSWMDLHERSLAALPALTGKVLVLNGELDWNVPAGEAGLWGDALATAGVKHAVVTLPCVTHALNCVTESDPTAITPGDLGRTVAPEVVEILLTFLAG